MDHWRNLLIRYSVVMRRVYRSGEGYVDEEMTDPYGVYTEDMRREEDAMLQTYTKEKEIYTDPAFKAMIARAAYEDNWIEADRSGRGDLPGTEWKYQSSLSDARRAVWYNKYLNYVVIAYRGTNFGGAGQGVDLATDVAIGLNATSLTPMYREDTAHYQRVVAAYPNATIEVTGHSLGGHRAKTIGRNFEVPSFGINEGATPIQNIFTAGDALRCRLFPNSKKCQHTAVRVENDPISLSASLYGPVTTHSYPANRDFNAWSKDSYLDAHTDAIREVLPLNDALLICNDDRTYCI